MSCHFSKQPVNRGPGKYADSFRDGDRLRECVHLCSFRNEQDCGFLDTSWKFLRRIPGGLGRENYYHRTSLPHNLYTKDCVHNTRRETCVGQQELSTSRRQIRYQSRGGGGSSDQHHVNITDVEIGRRLHYRIPGRRAYPGHESLFQFTDRSSSGMCRASRCRPESTARMIVCSDGQHQGRSQGGLIWGLLPSSLTPRLSSIVRKSARELSFGIKINALAYHSRELCCPEIFSYDQNSRRLSRLPSPPHRRMRAANSRSCSRRSRVADRKRRLRNASPCKHDPAQKVLHTSSRTEGGDDQKIRALAANSVHSSRRWVRLQPRLRYRGPCVMAPPLFSRAYRRFHPEQDYAGPATREGKGAEVLLDSGVDNVSRAACRQGWPKFGASSASSTSFTGNKLATILYKASRRPPVAQSVGELPNWSAKYSGFESRAVVVQWLDRSPTYLGETGSILARVACENRAGRYRSSVRFLADIQFPQPPHSGAAAYSPRFALVGSQDLDVGIGKFREFDDLRRLDSPVLWILEPHLCVHWLLTHAWHLWDSQGVALQGRYWLRNVQGGICLCHELQHTPPTRGEPGSIPGRFTADFRNLKSVRTMPLVGGLSRGSPVSPNLSFRCFPILTSLHPHRLPRPRCSEPTKSLPSPLPPIHASAKMASQTINMSECYSLISARVTLPIKNRSQHAVGYTQNKATAATFHFCKLIYSVTRLTNASTVSEPTKNAHFFTSCETFVSRRSRRCDRPVYDP
ncbi:hypothetical protein PR048_007922 [Dryococelus australis]|uniref:Uncharacterized protein n=1 Tax=Dryococelus australis TaxID=614101 RepID=A0ABQ9HVM2_9NEOP|nr:hypothetical protein PR048_007922 [Dryococelus australis]